MTAMEQTSFDIIFKTLSDDASSSARVSPPSPPPLKKPRYPRFEEEDPPLEGEEYDDDDDSVEDAVLDPEPEGAEDPTAELKRLAEENAELRRQLAASAKGGDA